jgi:hypothetical protein
MNFVDVQPNSFLDYAFTSPTPAAVPAMKHSKTSRKQNRCCDQCRKGKRACDAAILEDALRDDSKAGLNPTAFHYSGRLCLFLFYCKRKTDHADVFGPLASCSNCEKTKKMCTFEWLRSQRVLHSGEMPANLVPSPKRRRTSSTKSPGHSEELRQNVVGPQYQQSGTSGDALAQRPASLDLGVTFADFPCGMSDSLDPYQYTNCSEAISPMAMNMKSEDFTKFLNQDDLSWRDDDSGKGSSLETFSDILDDGIEQPFPHLLSKKPLDNTVTPRNGKVTRMRRKRRRSGSSTPYGAPPCPAVSFTSNLVLSNNNAVLTEGLLKIYHDSFENALSCWLTERTCPYSTKSDIAYANDARPDWNRIYHHVFRLDRRAANIRGRQLTFKEDQAAAKALNMAIYSFATQWAQSSPRRTARYPFDGTDPTSDRVENDSAVRAESEFDQLLQINAWHEAHNALHAASEIESFRVVLAQIVFSLTQKPVGASSRTTTQEVKMDSTVQAEEKDNSETDVDQDLNECNDLLSKLDIAIGADGPPTHLEQGLRLIHSLRSRVTMCNEKPRLKPRMLHPGKQYRSSNGQLDKSDRAAVDLLFWLGIMFDTLSSAMYRRPLVVSDEDSDIYPRTPENDNSEDSISDDKSNGLWDGYLFARQDNRLRESQVRWPCSFDQAAALLCDAAPVKVLLFRKITRIQTLLTRSVRGGKVDKSISAALNVHAHWTMLYAPFIQDCVQYHDQLHPRIQSWYTCLAGHWHLATLLLADLMEIVNESKIESLESHTQRASEDFVARFREESCRIVSDMASRACPRDDASFSQSREYHFALNQGSLLTEPWTAVLIRVFAKAGVTLLEADTMLPLDVAANTEETFRRANDCVRALWYLGRKSDMALSAAKILGNALKARRKDVQEKVKDMTSYLDAELWHGFENLDGTVELQCDS